MIARLFDRAAAAGSLLILISLGMLSWYFAQRADRDAPDSRPRAVTNDPDYFVEGLTLLRSDAEGRPAVRVEAARSVHRPVDRSVEFEKPHLITLNESRPTVNIRADRGVGPESGESTRLIGNVRVVRLPTPEQSELTATTDHADVDLVRKIVTTDAPVLVNSGGDWMKGVGMTLDSDARTIQLDSRVRGQFAPRAAPASAGGR